MPYTTEKVKGEIEMTTNHNNNEKIKTEKRNEKDQGREGDGTQLKEITNMGKMDLNTGTQKSLHCKREL